MTFCNAFDEALARHGPPAVFLRDDEGTWRFVANWTRDAWERAEGTPEPGWSFVLLRDRATGFVTLALATSPSLLATHPRCDVRAYDTLEAAHAARTALGRPPVVREAW